MAKYIDYEVSGKILIPGSSARAVVSCNSDYILRFTFSSEWNAYPDKSVLLSDGTAFYSIPLAGGAVECPLPRIDSPRVFDIGVTAGDGTVLSTVSLPLTVLPSIRSKANGRIEASEEVTPDDLARLCEALETVRSTAATAAAAIEEARSAVARANEAADSIGTAKEDAAYAAARASTAANSATAAAAAADASVITGAEINAEGDLILARKDGSEHNCGRATGPVGKTAYQYAAEGGYTGTEAEFAAKLAQDYENIAVVQTTGNSEASVMSQKAVTDAISSAITTALNTEV